MLCEPLKTGSVENIRLYVSPIMQCTVGYKLAVVCVKNYTWSDLKSATILRDIYFYGGIISALFLCVTFFIFVHFK